MQASPPPPTALSFSAHSTAPQVRVLLMPWIRQAVDHVLVDALGERVGLLEHHARRQAQLGDSTPLAKMLWPSRRISPSTRAAIHQVVHPVEAAQQQADLPQPDGPMKGHALLGMFIRTSKVPAWRFVEQVQPGHFQKFDISKPGRGSGGRGRSASKLMPWLAVSFCMGSSLRSVFQGSMYRAGDGSTMAGVVQQGDHSRPAATP